MKKTAAAFALGLFLGGAGSALAEFGWTDTDKLRRVAEACEGILAELRALRHDMREAKR